MVILDQLRILPMEISIVICINQSFNVGNFRRHFRSTELKCWPWKFLWLFVLPLANFELGNFHGHFGLTPLESFDAGNFHRQFALHWNTMLSKSTLIFLHKINPSSSIWKYFRYSFIFLTWIFFSGNNCCQPWISCKPFMQKKHVCNQNLVPFTTPSKNWQFWHSFLIILPRYTKRKVVKYSIY